MDLILKRTSYTADGIFGELFDNEGNLIAFTLEHSFPDGSSFKPKVLEGVYKCVRHLPVRLTYDTFILLNVPPFQGNEVTGILIHIGNFNKDSDGCILVGSARKENMVINSKEIFTKIMNIQKGIISFTLTIKG